MNSDNPKKSRFQIGLAKYVILAPILAAGLAMVYVKTIGPRLQKANVNKLLELGSESDGCYGVAPRILVWYESDLTWDEFQNRFIVTVEDAGRFDFQSKIGDDFNERPIAVEIFCNPDAEKLKQLLTRLPTLRQIWVCEVRDKAGKLTGNVSHKKIGEWFPKIKISSPRLWGERLDDNPL